MSEVRYGYLGHMHERMEVDGGEARLSSIVSEGGWYIRQDAATKYFELWGVPQFGGTPYLVDSYTDIVDAILQGRSFT